MKQENEGEWPEKQSPGVCGNDSPQQLRQAAANPKLTEDLALSLLAKRDLPPLAIEALARNGAVLKYRRVILALVKHPRTPRQVSLPLLRHLYTFELMQVALAPTVAPEVKLAADETLVARLDTISSGERITLGKRSSARLAERLLLDTDARVLEAALLNPYMTTASMVKALMNDQASVKLAAIVARHSRWSVRSDVQVALLQCGKLPSRLIPPLVGSMASHTLETALQSDSLPALVKATILEELRSRSHQLRPADD